MKIGYLMQAGVPDIRDEPLSGPANHVKQVFRELQALGHEVRLVAQLDGRFWVSDDFETLSPIDINRLQANRRVERLWHIGEKGVRRIQGMFGLPYAAWFESRRFALACQQELNGFDILYERMGWMGYGGGIAASRLNIPWVLEVNGDHLDELASLGIAPTGSHKWLSKWVMGRAIQQAAHVVAVGEGWKQRFLERWTFPVENISVVENGSEMVDRLNKSRLATHQPLHLFTTAAHADPVNKGFDAAIASSLSAVAGSAVSPYVNIIYIGGFEPWHGVTILIEAVAKAIAQNASIHLLLVGSGSEQQNIVALIHRLNLNSAVTMTGYLSADEMLPYLEQAEIGISCYYGRANFSGLKILDYKAAGLATIASGQNGEPSILEHGKTGLIVRPGDVDALAAAVLELSRDAEQRREMGKAARTDAEAYHRWRHTAEQLEEIFNRVKESFRSD